MVEIELFAVSGTRYTGLFHEPVAQSLRLMRLLGREVSVHVGFHDEASTSSRGANLWRNKRSYAHHSDGTCPRLPRCLHRSNRQPSPVAAQPCVWQTSPKPRSFPKTGRQWLQPVDRRACSLLVHKARQHPYPNHPTTYLPNHLSRRQRRGDFSNASAIKGGTNRGLSYRCCRGADTPRLPCRRLGGRLRLLGVLR